MIDGWTNRNAMAPWSLWAKFILIQNANKCPGSMFNSLDQNPLSPALKSAFFNSCLCDLWHTKALGVRLQVMLGIFSILENNYFQHLA